MWDVASLHVLVVIWQHEQKGTRERIHYRAFLFPCRADRESGSFWSGFAIGGVVCGVLGFVFAPQISQALLGEEQRLRLPRFLDEDEDPEVTKQNLAEKIAQLNAAIDDVSSQLKSQDIAIEDAVETSSS